MPEEQVPPEPEEEVKADASRRRGISQDQLKEILGLHRLYFDSGGKQGKKAKLQGAKLQGAKLQGVNLREADLRNAALGKVDLQEANLWKADLAGAKLQGANLQGANLGKAGLREANLWKAKLKEANLRDTDLGTAALGEVDLQKAYLFGANLQGAKLQEANLQGAILVEASLRQANLRQANLQGAKLVKADLQGAYLKSASLETPVLGDEELLPGASHPKTDLTNADFRNADLRDAALSNVVGLLAEKLAGANLSNAKVPDDIAKFVGLTHVAETSQNARKIFFGLLLGCVYSWLTIATTTDARLLTNSASTPLPIIQTQIPIAWFYWVAPLILLCVYFYLHLYLHRLWHGLAALPAIFPDGRELQDRVYPWLMNGLVVAHFPILRRERTPLSYVQNGVSIILAWLIVPATLVSFWIRYMPKQDWWGTGLQIACIVLATGFGALLYLLARRTLRGVQTDFSLTTMWRDGRTYLACSVVALAIALTAVSWGAINGVKSKVPDPENPRTWVPYAFNLAGYVIFADFREATVSIRPTNFWELPAKDRAAAVAGAKLKDASLRYANAFEAFMAKADLRGANLQGANLQGADLKGVKLQGADLQGANLREAKLQDAILTGADLTAAQLWDADLSDADLRGARFEDAKLTDANLRRAKLEGANLLGASLNGASVGGCVQLMSADRWEATYRSEDLACGGTTLLPFP